MIKKEFRVYLEGVSSIYMSLFSTKKVEKKVEKREILKKIKKKKKEMLFEEGVLVHSL